MDYLIELDEQQLMEWLATLRAFGPLPALALPFLKSFIPPLPTIVIVGGNAAVYGLWPGFLYSWLGLVAGSVTAFLLVRRFTDLPFVQRYMRKPRVARSLAWVRRNAFGYVFLLSLFPIGPFVVINVAAGIARMRIRLFIIAAACGKAVMVFAVSLVGHDIGRFIRHPLELLYVLAFLAGSWWICRRLERRYGTVRQVEPHGSGGSERHNKGRSE